jgi:hypothetical protein
MAMPRLMWLDACLSLWRLRFDPRCLHEIYVGQSGTETGFLPRSCFFPGSIITSIFHSHFHYMLLLAEEEIGEAWELPKKQCSFGNQGKVNRKVISFYVPMLHTHLHMVTLFSTSKQCL